MAAVAARPSFPGRLRRGLRSRPAPESRPSGAGHDFGRLRVHADAPVEEDLIHRPLVDEFRRREEEVGVPPGLERSEGEIKYRGLGLPCPSRTETERIVDLTAAGLRDGYRTAYGAMAVMRVHPTEGIWNGTRIAESLTEVSSTCPDTLSREPLCTGSSVFTVGAPGRSSRIGDQPGRINRFYDFHVSRSRVTSFLHDPARNPRGLDSCQATCEQRYSCGGRVIGTHRVVRRFRKAVHAGRDVTICDVTKT